jgi:lipid-A-disaccharide synthase-like uncharacterized protein
MEQSVSYFWAHIVASLQHYVTGMPKQDAIWLVIGLLGQCMFMMRFIVQWLHSERHGESLIPVSFWYLSLSGGLIVLAYGVHKLDPVIILGQLPGTIVYVRNLMLIHRKKKVNWEAET